MIPQAVGAGKARVKLSFDAWKDGRVVPATIEVPVAILDVKDSPQLRATLHINAGPAAAIFAPDGKTLAAWTRQGEIKLWDIASMRELRTLVQPGTVSGLEFLPDSRTLVIPWYETLDKDEKLLSGRYKIADVRKYRGGVKLWDVTTGKERGVLQRESPRGVTWIALSPDGKTLVAKEVWREKDGKDSKQGIALWDVAAGKVIRDLDVNSALMVFAPDGKTLAANTGEGVQLLDVATGQKRGKLGEAKTSLFELAFAPDGKTLAGIDLQGAVRLWDVASGKEKARLTYGDSRFVHSLAFAPDGKILAIGIGPRNSRTVEPGEVVLWDTATKTKRLTLHGHIGYIFSLAFNADGTLLASAGGDKTIKLWDIASRSASKR